MNEIIYAFWTGTNPMTPNRIKNLDLMKEVLEVPVQLITPKNLGDYITDCPLHPGYQYLSETTKSDYLRTYFMYHHGGGYADIKVYYDSWKSEFDTMQVNPRIDVIGARESPDGIGECNSFLRPIAEKLIQSGYFIMRKGCLHAEMMWKVTQQLMDNKFNELKDNPARDYRDHYYKQLFDEHGEMYRSKFPFNWGDLYGNISHRVCALLVSNFPNSYSYTLSPADCKSDYL